MAKQAHGRQHPHVRSPKASEFRFSFLAMDAQEPGEGGAGAEVAMEC